MGEGAAVALGDMLGKPAGLANLETLLLGGAEEMGPAGVSAILMGLARGGPRPRLRRLDLSRTVVAGGGGGEAPFPCQVGSSRRRRRIGRPCLHEAFNMLLCRPLTSYLSYVGSSVDAMPCLTSRASSPSWCMQALAEALSVCGGLEVLELSGNGGVGDEGLTQHVLPAARGLPCLTILRLEGGGYGHGGAVGLAAHLSDCEGWCPRLAELHLGHNPGMLGDPAAVRALAVACGRRARVCVLGLQACGLTGEGVAMLMSEGGPWAGLEVMSLAHNHGVGDGGVRALSEHWLMGQRCEALREVDLTACGFGNEGARVLSEALRSDAPRKRRVVVRQVLVKASLLREIEQAMAGQQQAGALATH